MENNQSSNSCLINNLKSKALEVNIASYSVDVVIDSKYSILQEIMSEYYGLMEGLNTFLKELSHPYKNWQFIVQEARTYSLDYFHLMKKHPKGPEAADLFIGIFEDAIESSVCMEVKSDAIDNFLLFIQTIIKNSNSEISNFAPVINKAFNRIEKYPDEIFFLFANSFYQITKTATMLVRSYQRLDKPINDFAPINLLLLKYFKYLYFYWLNQEDPQTWFEEEAGKIDNKNELNEIFKDISHQQIRTWLDRINKIKRENSLDAEKSKKLSQLEELSQMPGHNQIVSQYRKIPQKLFKAGGQNGNRWKLLFIFRVMNISGLCFIQEEALRDINKTLSWLIGNENQKNIRQMIQKTLSILKTQTCMYPSTVLDCVLNMGKGVYKTDDIDLVNFFIDLVIDLGFQSPMIQGIGDDWQVKVNNAHMKNIRTWLELVELHPKWSARLLSYLTIYLSLHGVFIKDTDLFPRDITKLLNSDIKPVYNLVKQLARLFPVYFNEIGAEGKLRDISTDLDEISNRKDVLIHFLRKQSHVESSNLIINFMEAIFNFWKTKDKELIKSFVPPDIYNQIDNTGLYVNGVHKAMLRLEKKELKIPNDFMSIQSNKLDALFANADIPDKDKERVKLAVSLYKVLNQKYKLDFVEIDSYLAQLQNDMLPDFHKVKQALAEQSLNKKLVGLLNYLELLKEVILSKESYEIYEDIYKKRHFTVDIPSMYGRYHEKKFDALGLAFRIESVVNVLFEQLVEDINLDIITRSTFYQIYDRLKLFDQALKLDGIASIEIERQFDILSHALEVRGFTFTQYLDIFKGFARAVKNIVNDYFNNIHEQNLSSILTQTSIDLMLPKYLSGSGIINHERLKHKVSEIFLRDRLAFSLGLQQLDLFLGRILKTLFNQSNKLPRAKLRRLLNYDPQRAMTCISHENPKATGLINLGSKGYNMVKLQNFGMPVPSGFILTTEVFRCREVINSFLPAEQNLKEQIAKHISIIEKITGKAFGNPANPLLFSVRSGSAVSQPGMMDTFLDVGINEEIVAGIAEKTNNVWFAWDCYRRFLQGYGMAFNLERDDFDAIIDDSKKKLGITYKEGFTGEQMKGIALAYKKMIRDAGAEIIDDPFEQLYMTIKMVLNSWESSKAKAYRKIIGISDDWGTAITIQEMIFGNLSRDSGTGVFFTHNPRWSGDTLRLWGDFTLGNQGEDVVSGLVNTMPISVIQQGIEMRETDITLETHFPEIYKGLKHWANTLIYRKGWSPQEMEFTFESPSIKDLYLLQTRDMAMRERKKALTFDIDEKKDADYLGHGIGVSGGAMSGRIVFSLDEIYKWKHLEPDNFLVLIRSDTVPDDILEIDAADGLLTARGGLTSHAAVVAHRLGKTCVVGCGNLMCNEKERRCVVSKKVIKSGDYISIDGREGSVYYGAMKIRKN